MRRESVFASRPQGFPRFDVGEISTLRCALSRREDIDNDIWADPDFEALSPDATLLYLWSFTNPRCGMAGVYKVSHRAMAESKVALERIPAVLEELAAAGFAFYEESVLWVRTRVKHLRSRSPQMAKSIANDLEKLSPGHPLRVRFLAEYGSHPWLREALPKPSSDPSVNLSQSPADKGNSHNLSGTSLEVPGLGEGEGQGSSSSKVKLPGDFPDELRPHLKAVWRILSALAERHEAKAVNVVSLASVVMARPRKPLVRAAHDFAAWSDGKAQRRKDVVSGYRNWLDRTDDLATVERLNGAAPPASQRDARRSAGVAAMDRLANGQEAA